MPSARQDRHRLGPQSLALEGVGRGGFVEAPDHEVDFAGGEQRQQFVGAALLQANTQAGLALPEPREHARQHARRRDGEHAKGEPTRARRRDQIERLVEAAPFGEHTARRFHESRPGERRPRAARVALEEFHAEDILGLAQGLAEGGLGEMQRGGGFQQAAMLRDRVADAKVLGLQALVEMTGGFHAGLLLGHGSKQGICGGGKSQG